MSLHQEINQRSEPFWVICLDKTCEAGNLPPVPGAIDWYNNHQITRHLLGKKLSLNLGERTLVASTGLLPCRSILVYGLGEKSSLTSAAARKILQDLGKILTDLQEPSAWIVVSKDIPSGFIDEMKKSRASVEALELTSITAG